MKTIRRIFFAIFPFYKRTDYILTTWGDADRMIKKDPNWRIAYEDNVLSYPLVALEKRKRIVE